MIYKNICTKRTYTKDGVEKTIWLNVGTLRVTDDGKEFMELNMFPSTPFYVFEKKTDEDKQFEASQPAPKSNSFTPSANDPVEGIPF